VSGEFSANQCKVLFQKGQGTSKSEVKQLFRNKSGRKHNDLGDLSLNLKKTISSWLGADWNRRAFHNPFGRRRRQCDWWTILMARILKIWS